jgi:hypothetical protein
MCPKTVEQVPHQSAFSAAVVRRQTGDVPATPPPSSSPQPLVARGRAFRRRAWQAGGMFTSMDDE